MRIDLPALEVTDLPLNQARNSHNWGLPLGQPLQLSAACSPYTEASTAVEKPMDVPALQRGIQNLELPQHYLKAIRCHWQVTGAETV